MFNKLLLIIILLNLTFINFAFTKEVKAAAVASPTSVSASTPKQCGKQILLKWKKVSGADSYVIYRTDSNNNIVVVPQNNSIATSTSNQNFLQFYDTLNNQAKYYYEISAAVQGVEGPKSKKVSANSSVACAPVAQNFTASTGVKCGGTIDLKWDIVPEATKYVIQKNKNGKFVTIATLKNPITSYTDPLALGPYDNGYYGPGYFSYRILTYVGSENSMTGASAKSSLVCDAKVGVCGDKNNTCVSGGVVDNVQDTDTEYLWGCWGSFGGQNASCRLPKTLDGVCGEKMNTCKIGNVVDESLSWWRRLMASVISIFSQNNYSWKCSGLNGGKTVSCIDSSIAPANGECGASVNSCISGVSNDVADTELEYLWKCDGKNGGSGTSCSLPISGPDSPKNVVISGTSTCDGSIGLKWNPVSGVSGYKIYRENKLDDSPVFSLVGTSTTNEYLDSVDERGNITYKVSATVGAREGTTSPEISIDTVSLCPLIPDNATDYDYVNESLDPVTDNNIGLLVDGEQYSASKKYGIGKWRSFDIVLPSYITSGSDPVTQAVLFGDDGVYSEQTSQPISYQYKNILDYENVGKKLIRFFLMKQSGEIVSSPAFYLNFASENGICGTKPNTCTGGDLLLGVYNGQTVADTSTWWAWTCSGIGRGTTASCEIRKTFSNGVCGTTSRSCKSGELNDFGSSRYWECMGSLGGFNSYCSI